MGGIPPELYDPAPPPQIKSNGSSNTSSQNESVGAVNLPEGSPWQTSLPLGDGRYTTSAAKKGYIYLCHVGSGGGALGNPSWIHGSSWTPSEKVAVQGSVSWPDASYKMSVSGDQRNISSNGLPTDHPTGVFPIAASDPAHAFDQNPNSISAQSFSFSLPASPSINATPGCIYGQVGIMNDGVELFDGFDAENRDALAHEVQDSYEGHPEKTGVYHNHGFEGSIEKDSLVSQVVGFAFDGFPITGGKLPNGNYLTTDDLDECHGITSAIGLDGKQVMTYHYVLTQDFPYSVSCFKGTSTFRPSATGGQQAGGPSQMQGGQPVLAPMQGMQPMQQQPQQMQQGGTPPAPPQAAIDACAGKQPSTYCAVLNGPTGTCQQLGSYFACKPM